jgi:hypothetical protein
MGGASSCAFTNERPLTSDLLTTDPPTTNPPTTNPPTTDQSHRLTPGMTWQWQLSGSIDISIDAAMYDIDLFDTPISTVDQLHADGRTVICYFSAGSWENWRPDANQFPHRVKGHDLEGWPGEQWLDIRQRDLLAPLMQARLALALQKGCDGVEPDNVDAYINDSGFPLTFDEQINYNIWLSNEAHKRGLLILLKNDLDQVEKLLPYVDGALNEQCFEYDECDKLILFVKSGKAVFGVEYTLETAEEMAEFCSQAIAWNFSWLKKNETLDAWRQPCG